MVERMLVLLGLVFVVGCAPDGPLVLTVTSPELMATVTQAANDWREVCGADIVFGDDGVVVEHNGDGMTATQHGMTYKNYWGEPQSIRLKLTDDVTAARHEIGHALGHAHNPDSPLMRAVVSGQHAVTAEDCR